MDADRGARRSRKQFTQRRRQWQTCAKSDVIVPETEREMGALSAKVSDKMKFKQKNFYIPHNARACVRKVNWTSAQF